MPIKAAMVTPNMSLGGAERWIVDLIRYSDPTRVIWPKTAVSGFGGADECLCQELRKHTELYANKPPGERPAHAQAFHWESMHHLPGPDFREAVSPVIEDADVIVTWGQPNMSYWFGDAKVPRICVSHSTFREDQNHPCQGITHLAAVSHKAMEYFDRRGGSRFLPRKVIYNGVSLERVRAEHDRALVRHAWGVGPDEKVILYLGRFSEEKNCFAAARAAKELGDGYHAIHYGWGKQQEELTEFCEHYLYDRYRVFGPVELVGDILNAADCMVLASHREAFSLTLIEAWLAGLPVIGTPVGCVPELEAEYGDMVFKVGMSPNGPALAAAVKEALEGDTREKVIHTAKSFAWEHLTIESMIGKWMSYLEEVVIEWQREKK